MKTISAIIAASVLFSSTAALAFGDIVIAPPAKEQPDTLEELTPLFHAARLGATAGLQRLFIKDESLNPTNSFKARGQSAAITRAATILYAR